MIKTTDEICLSCEYSEKITGGKPACMYRVMEKKRRGCPVGLCDKYKKKAGRKRPL
jgi:hypothetical protein